MAREPTEASKVGTRRVITDFTGRNRTVTPPGTSLDVVLEGDSPCGVGWQDGHNGINGGARGGQWYNPNPPNQDGQRQRGGG